MAKIELSTALVSVSWLKEHIGHPDLVVLDGSWFMPGSERNAIQEYADCHIPGARFFDFDGEIKDVTSSLPHMLPDANTFSAAVSALGISKSTTVVVYDSQGIFSAPRVWWMFHAMGHSNVAVLDGGLPAWQSAGYSVTSEKASVIRANDFEVSVQDAWVISADELNEVKAKPDVTILDARPSDRFYGRVPEPREGVRSGHIPGAKSLPFVQLVKDGYMVDKERLQQRFKALVESSDDQIVFSCGSGITACILALGAFESGYKQLRVYDGSWTEWGSDSRYPVTLI
ncbi:sulfurtransferase [Thaumasiovibrio subtropicus]|uniref:sulfurtransferase n=1 Tax=Thaumasiovibrio subtropicus TaxID=1891207 RepID=UPI000B35F8B4|nr:rhodanese-like domain-containing protein [Thaumasiovibrio subtropicus]